MLHKDDIFCVFLWIILSIVFISCNPKTVKPSNRLTQALSMAGENRSELEKVLAYYENDLLKYRAAVFLIENMPYHYSYKDTAYINAYYNELDSVFTITQNAENELKDSLFKKVKEKYPGDGLIRVSDVTIITSAFLIDNIERAFTHWQTEPWAAHLGFEEFCEYLLPYKVCETQILENWRLYFSDIAAMNLDKMAYCKPFKNSVVKACEFVNLELRDTVKPRVSIYTGVPSEIIVRRMSTLSKAPLGTCEDYTHLAAVVMRAKGIPVAVDFTPQWPFRSFGHYWDVLFNNNNKNIVVEGCIGKPGMPHMDDHIMAKVYRTTYSVNREIERINVEDRHVPDVFQNVFMKDVTREYMMAVDVKMKVTPPSQSKYIYLSVFDNKNWVPVCWGKMSLGSARFKDVGQDILYLPVSMSDYGKMTAVADPVIVGRNGEITHVRVDTVNRQTMTLSRKYPVFPHVYDVMHRVLGGQIQASNHADFKDFVVYHTINKYGTTAEDVVLKNTGEYRYWCYFSPKGGNCNMAELQFFEKDSTNPIRGKVIGTLGSYWKDGKNEKESAFDGDALTFFDAPYGDSRVGMDFGKPVAINRMYYLPRNDGNCIEPGNDYELVYWADNSWQSLGKQKATSSRLIFENCPTNGLYLLHNQTKGREERIFTYENGNQVWW